jgi:hypothetical protein
MNDDKKLNQPTDNTNSDDYQKILDEAAASVKPEDTQIPPTETNTNEPEPTVKLKDINSLQLEASDNKIIASSTDIPSIKTELTNEPTIDFQSSEPITPEENLTTKEPIKTETEPTQNPEEIKAQIDKILADDSSNTGLSTKVPKKSNNFKNIFIFSLIIFFIIAGAWVYFLFFYQSTTQENSAATLPTPTETISQEVCELNGTTYKVGESFKSADGCNTCSCEAVGTIACTEMACTSTPAVSTSSAATSTIPKDWKIYTDSIYKFSINYPLTWTLAKTVNGFSLISSKMAKAVAEANGEPTVFGPEIDVSIYNSLSKLSGSAETKNLKEYVSSNLKNVKEISVNGINGYSGYTDYPSHYIYLQKNNIFIRIFDGVNLEDSDYNNSEIKKIIDTLKFN